MTGVDTTGWLNRPDTMQAQVATTCSRCRGPIRVGDPIKLDYGVTAQGFWLGPCCIERARGGEDQ